MSDLKIQGEFEMDTTKGEQALARVESGARRMANTVQQAGDKAADAMGGIGDKADQSAKVTERATAAIATATKRAISEAQRAVVEAQGYSLKSADGLEALARLRGADIDAIQGQTKALRELRTQHEAMLSAQREAVGAALFEQQHEAARKLVQDAEYVRTWASALDLLEAKQRELAALPDFERERDAASQAKRRADATYALTQALDIQEAKERELAALPAFEREREAAAQARRRADATAALTQVLDQQEAMERKLAAQGSFLTSLEGQADAIGKTRSQLLELQAAQLGVSDKAAPMIARLREQEVQFSKSGVSAAQTAAALRQLPAQFSDIVVSLQAGQAPLTVFLQQGSQIKDSFGGAGEAVKAMAGYVSGLITPVTLLGAGVAALAVAYNMGSKEMDEYRRSIVLTGNAAGVTAGHLQDMASRIGQGAGTQREAAQALAVFVKDGKVASGNLESFARTAVEFSRVTGESVEDVAKNFSDLAKDPLTATLKLNESMNFLTESTLRQIKALHDQGSATEAADLAQKTYAQTLDSRKDEIIRNLGAIEKAWRAIKLEAGHAMDAFLDIGRARTLETRLSKAQKALDDYTSTLPGRRTTETVAAVQAYGGEQGLRNEIAGLQELIENQRKSADMERQRGEAVKASSWLAQEAAKHESDLERQRRAVAEATAQYQESLKNDTLNQAQRNQLEREYLAIVTGITQAKDRKKSGGKSEQEKELEKQAKLLAELSGLSSDFYEQWDRLIAAFKRGALSSAQLTEEQGKLLAKQPAIKAANDAHAKSVKDAETAYRKFLDSIGKTEERYAGLADQQEAANASFGKSKTAIEELALAQAKLALANEKDAGPWTPEHIAQMEKAVSQQERYVAALKAGDLKTINAHTDELLRNAQEQAKLYRDEYQLMGLTALERAKIVALRQVELKYAKELADIDTMSEKSPEDRAAKLAERAKVEQAKRIAGEAAVSKVIQDDWTRTADQINQSLTDALMRGFESGKDFAQNFRDTLKNMFSTLVLRPTISAILMPVAGTITGALGLAGGANAGQGGVLSTVGNIGSGYSLLSGLGAFGGGLSGGVGGLLGSLGLSATGTTLAGALDAGMIALQAGNIAGGLGTLAGALGPIALGLAGLVSVFGGMDRSGTPHWGAAAEYDGTTLTGGNEVFRRSGTAGTYSAQAQAGVDAVAKGVGDTLNGLARAFGRDGGYSVMTAYSDDSSDDPGFGSLRITRDGQKIRDWEDDRYSKWAPGIFADGEEGWKLYLAAIAKDTRQALTDMDLPGWADKMLTDLGDTVTMEQLAGVVQQIGVINIAFEQLGSNMAMFAGITDDLQGALLEAAGGIDALVSSAGAFYQGFYTDAERMDALRGQLNTALSDLDLSIDPNLGSDAKAQFRTAVEEAMASGNAELVASLLAISGNFASAADYFEQLSQTAAEAARKAAEDAQRSVYDMFKRAADRDRKDLQAQASSLSEAISGISSAVDLLKSNARDLYGEVDSTAQMLAAQGMVYVENALAGVRAGASVADYTGLSDAISAARGGLGSSMYQSEFERQRDTLVLAGQLSELGELGDLQLSVEERQLRAINEQLEYLDGLTARADELINGTVTLTGTVESYFQQLLGLLGHDEAADGSAGGVVGGRGGDNGSGFSSGGDATGAGKETPQMRAWYIRSALAGIDLSSADGQAQLVEFGRMHRYSGYTAAEVARAFGISLDEFERLVGFRDFPAFATGINRVPYDMVAQIHKDEAIVPAAYNPFNPGAQRFVGGESALLEELRALRKKVEELSLISAVTASNTAPLPVMADQFDSVTEGGNAMRGDAGNLLEL